MIEVSSLIATASLVLSLWAGHVNRASQDLKPNVSSACNLERQFLSRIEIGQIDVGILVDP